jgi:cellulose synthase/poly-beta-1,6-N-acetylglucosamine synthase-like glycosyltransferase
LRPRIYCENCGAVFAEMLPRPLISGTEGLGTRPYWSVMIPTYNPRANYLEETLNKVLQQDPGPEQMQIEVVYDCSEHNTFRFGRMRR